MESSLLFEVFFGLKCSFLFLSLLYHVWKKSSNSLSDMDV